MRATEVVHDDISTSRGEESSICLSETTASAGDDDGLVIKTQVGHDGKGEEGGGEERGNI